MFTILAISGVLTIIFASLYLHGRLQMQRMVQAEKSKNAELQQALEELQQRSHQESRDPLTNLLSYKTFEDRVNQGIKESDLHRFVMGALYIDIDEFNLLNHALGTAAGNDLLCAVGVRLQSCLRQVDSLCRQNKDTFVILLGQLAKQETAIIIIQRIMQAMSQPFTIGQHELTLTVCIGASFYPQDGKTAQEFLRNAEYAMLQAKQRGKDSYQFYQDKLLTECQRELSLYNSLSSDTFLDNLQIKYQPIMDMTQHSMLCADAQVSWQHKTLGTISAEELFFYADKHHKLNKITERVLREACRKFLGWRVLGLKPQMLCLTIWLKQLEQTQFVYNISQILLEEKMQPEWLMLVVRDNTTPPALDVLEKSFNMLNYIGINIVLDHFGSSSIPLHYVKSFPVRYIKLDPALIKDVAINEKTRAVVKAVTAFAHELSVEVIATGVESEVQAVVLQEQGIVIMQGLWMSKPLSEAEMTDKMTNV